ncbi:hypothetical protein [Phyllobacterium leguminum]|uniref:Uncharacterized protein n=1 Tax=Phyllobacterium leguminum TaxID=314237 RepID=A0A318SV82_9HYPH|nr:hypothetical protein [Phyllobacterium leguminum]PYE85325.1 hypothetical protein C7477_1308 [Phyllobacterium leguminum]
MNQPQIASLLNENPQDENETSLEAVEVEFALGAQDVLSDGFDGALAKAAKLVNGEVLFNMPALDTSEAQRIGAIAVAGNPYDQIIFVTLLNDGTTLSLSPLTGGNALFESLGRNYAAVMRKVSEIGNGEQ